jgi:hypothetical protein
MAVLATAREVASALAYLHASGVVHGDLSGEAKASRQLGMVRCEALKRGRGLNAAHGDTPLAARKMAGAAPVPHPRSCHSRAGRELWPTRAGWNVMLCSSGAAAVEGSRGFVAKVAGEEGAPGWRRGRHGAQQRLRGVSEGRSSGAAVDPPCCAVPNSVASEPGSARPHPFARSDFGLSRTLEIRSKMQTANYGTLSHMPPELVLHGTVSRAVDVVGWVVGWVGWLGWCRSGGERWFGWSALILRCALVVLTAAVLFRRAAVAAVHLVAPLERPNAQPDHHGRGAARRPSFIARALKRARSAPVSAPLRRRRTAALAAPHALAAASPVQRLASLSLSRRPAPPRHSPVLHSLLNPFPALPTLALASAAQLISSGQAKLVFPPGTPSSYEEVRGTAARAHAAYGVLDVFGATPARPGAAFSSIALHSAAHLFSCDTPARHHTLVLSLVPPQLMRDCTAADPDARPAFTDVVRRLEGMLGELRTSGMLD